MNAHIQTLDLANDLQAEADRQLLLLADHAQALRRRLGLSEQWTMAKAIAGAGLALHLVLGVPVETAMRLASRAAGEVLHIDSSALKTRTSEARALVECVLTQAVRRRIAAARGESVYAEIVFAVLPFSQRAALQRRARRLRGRKGGRPASRRPWRA